MSTTANPTQSLYFGYGSNLWRAQMLRRCPQSTYLGIARLQHFRWIINDRGYANVVEQPATLNRAGKPNDDDCVWGLVYSLTEQDEAALDVNEGVPVAYTKELMAVDFWAAGAGGVDVDASPEKVQMLVYVDRWRTVPDVPKAEYVWRMNRGIEDAVEEGVPGEYVRGVLRGFIPEDGDGKRKGEVEELARRQAGRFVDED